MQRKTGIARIIQVLGLAGAFGAGWFAKSTQVSVDAGGVTLDTRRHVASGSVSNGRAGVSDGAATRTDISGGAEIDGPVVPGSGEAIAVMTAQEFGQELALLLRSDQCTPAGLRRKVALLEELDAERGVCTYFEYKRLFGVGLQSEAGQLVRDVLTATGSRDGALAVEMMLRSYPDGIEEFNSLVHGWALGAPDEAVAWFNSLPLEHPVYEKTLRGLFWGLVEADLDHSITAFNSLGVESMRPQDVESAGSSMALSMMTSHGVAGMDRWFEKLPDDLHVRAVEWSTTNLVRQPLEEVVPWLSAYAERSELLRGELQRHARRWADVSPEAALDWAGGFAGSATNGDLGGEMFRVTAGIVGLDVLGDWIARHPGHPALPVANGMLDISPAIPVEQDGDE